MHYYPPKNGTEDRRVVEEEEEEEYNLEDNEEEKKNKSFTLITPNYLLDETPYESFTSTEITNTLQRLLNFWKNNLQEHNLTGDIGVKQQTNHTTTATTTTTTTTTTTQRQQQPKHKPDEVDITFLHQRPLSQAHKLHFKHDRRLFLIKETSKHPLNTTTAPTKPTTRNEPRADIPRTSAWWLDITCPTSSDMHQLCKIFPLHPLTIEDILQQDTREKTETFHGLGYYLVCFRGLDPSNFNYQEQEGGAKEKEGREATHCTTNGDIHRTNTGQNKGSKLAFTSTILNVKEINNKEKQSNKKSNLIPILPNQLNDNKDYPRREEPPHPSNTSNYLNRPGLGVANMYLIVFRDGIISFHFENVQKHIQRVKDRIQSFSSDTGHVSPHWIAYGLMDSIVDEFFPVLELIEEETDELEEYLLDPIDSTSASLRRNEKGEGGGRKGWKKMRADLKKVRKSQAKIKQIIKPKMMNNNYNYKLKSLSMIDRSKMLNRITFNRRLVVSMARLIAQKFQTVHALRKRMIDDHFIHLEDPFADHQSKEIGLYLSDLQDHILSLTQALTFYDTILSNAHSTYLGVLRVGLNVTKQDQDVMIIRLYLITLIVLPMNTLIGLHSMNIHIPGNGDQVTHLLPDGSRAPFTVFVIILSSCFFIGIFFVIFIRKVIIYHSQLMFNRLFPKLFYFI